MKRKVNGISADGPRHQPLSSFDGSGSQFALVTRDSQLKVWETATEKLQLDFPLSRNLSATCTCVRWGHFSRRAQQQTPRKRKRTLSEDTVPLLALGTESGAVLIFDTALGSCQAELDRGHVTRVTSVAWCRDGQELFSASSDGDICHWDVSTGKLLTKWRHSDGNVTSLLVLPNGTHVAVAGRSIAVVELESKRIVKKFVGHTMDISELQYVERTSQSHEEDDGASLNGYLVSLSRGDRFVQAWQLFGETARKTSLASFLLPSEPSSFRLHLCSDKKVSSLYVLLEDGRMACFKHSFNGHCRTPFQPLFITEVNTPAEDQLPLLDVSSDGESHVTLVYGDAVKPAFERVAIAELLARPSLSREPLLATGQLKGRVAADDTKHRRLEPTKVSTAGAVLAPKKKERTLGEQLARSQRTRVSGTDSETDDHMTAANMTQLLVEGLVSEDATILQSVLQLSRTELVDATVAALPAAAVDSLLKQLAKRLDAHGTRGCIAVKWVRSVLKYHSSQAASLGDTLSSMYSTAATRTHSYLQVAKLRGRLQLLKQMASHQELDVDNDQLMTQQPMLTIDDASDSEDDGGSDALSDGGSDVGSAGGSDVMSDGEDGSSVPDVEENGVLSEEEENDSPSQVDSDSSIED